MSLSLRKLEAAGAAKPTRNRPTHGVQAYLKGGRLPSGRAWKRAQVEIEALRQALLRQYGGDAIKPDVAALVESAIEALTVQRLSSLYVKKAGILRRDSLRHGVFELHPVLAGQFLAYHNAVRLNLEAAARLAKGRAEGTGETLADIIRESDQAAAEKAAGARKETGGEEIAPPASNDGPPGPNGDPAAAEHLRMRG
jgi:hypothetical protein